MHHGWPEQYIVSEQLYDLIFDPNETHNMASDPSVSEVLAELRGRLGQWMQATDDPLLHGPVPAPPGARANDPDGVSPREPALLVS